jgi:hypothetical protein
LRARIGLRDRIALIRYRKAMANAWNDIPTADRDRAAKILAALEETFRPLAESLRIEDEPALTFDAAEDAE